MTIAFAPGDELLASFFSSIFKRMLALLGVIEV